MYYKVKLDSYDPATIGWRVATIPMITHPEKNRDRFSIPLRDGELVGSDIWRSNAYITVMFHVRLGWSGTYGNDTMDTLYDGLMRMLNGKSYLHIEIQNKSNHSSYDKAGRYEIVGWSITNEIRVNNDYMRIEVQFEVYPYKFLEISTDNPEYVIADRIMNNYDVAMPIYYMNRGSSGSVGNFSITVNGNTVSGQFPAEVIECYIDTRKQMVYYTVAGAKYEINNITGDYMKLWLPANYESVISNTGAGTRYTYPRFGVKI